MSANRVVPSGWIEESLVVSAVRERGYSTIMLCITIDCTGFYLFFLFSSLLSTPSLTLSLPFTPPVSPLYPALHTLYLPHSNATLQLCPSLPLSLHCTQHSTRYIYHTVTLHYNSPLLLFCIALSVSQSNTFFPLSHFAHVNVFLYAAISPV